MYIFEASTVIAGLVRCDFYIGPCILCPALFAVMARKTYWWSLQVCMKVGVVEIASTDTSFVNALSGVLAPCLITDNVGPPVLRYASDVSWPIFLSSVLWHLICHPTACAGRLHHEI